MNYWKWGSIVAVIIASFFLGRCNGIESITRRTGSDTVVTVRNFDTVYIPQPYAVIKDSIQYKIKSKTDTLFLEGETNTVYLPEETPKWIGDILNDYSSLRFYDTTYSEGNDSFRIVDTITRNRIKSRFVKASFKDSVITNTIILKPERRMVGYFTLGGLGNLKGEIGIAAGFQLKTKSEATFQYELIKMNQFPLIHKYTMGFPIRLIKPKN